MKTARQYIDGHHHDSGETFEQTIQRVLDDALTQRESLLLEHLLMVRYDLNQVRVELSNIKLQLLDLKSLRSVQVPPTIFPDPAYPFPYLTTTCSTPGVSSYHQNWNADEHQTAVDKFFASQNQPKQ